MNDIDSFDTRDRIVSSGSEPLILVDEQDNETGVLDKVSCHDGEGILHRAFSLFIFDDRGRLLIQRRAAGKRLWPLYWSNSCCSHPRAGETMEEATSRRLREELGISAELTFVYKFIYRAEYEDLGSEHELCWVYLGRSAEPVVPNRNEIVELEFLTPAALDRALAADKPGFTPWSLLEWEKLRREHAPLLESFAARG